MHDPLPTFNNQPQLPMVKIVLCLVSFLVLAGLVMQLRQQHLDLSYQTNRLHSRIEAQQAKLWNQQLRIAAYTAPRAIIETVGQHQIDLVPATPLPPATRIVVSGTSEPRD